MLALSIIIWVVVAIAVAVASTLGAVGILFSLGRLSQEIKLYGLSSIHLAFGLQSLAAAFALGKLVVTNRNLKLMPLPPEMLAHHRQLTPVLQKLRGVNLLTHAGNELGTWVLLGHKRLSIYGGEVLESMDGSLAVNIEPKGTPDWEFLKQHLEKSPIWKAVEEWKEATVDELQARRRLFNAVKTALMEQTGLPIGNYTIANDEEAVHPYLLESIYEDLFREAIGMPITKQWGGQMVVKEKGHLYLPNDRIALVSSDLAIHEIVIRLSSDPIEELGHLISNTGCLYKRADAAMKKLDDLAHKQQLSPSLPKSSRCEGCRSVA